jgi:hypothetical protein
VPIGKQIANTLCGPAGLGEKGRVTAKYAKYAKGEKSLGLFFFAWFAALKITVTRERRFAVENCPASSTLQLFNPLTLRRLVKFKSTNTDIWL